MSQAIKNAIAIAEQAQKDITEELKDIPQLAMRTGHVFKTMVNGFKVSANINLDGDAPVEKSGKLTHIFGRPLGSKKNRAVMQLLDNDEKDSLEVDPPATLQAVTPTSDEKSDLALFVTQALADLEQLEPKDLNEKYGDLVLRGVAIKLGMDVTATQPEKINAEFIKVMKTTLSAEKEKFTAAAGAIGKSGIQIEQEKAASEQLAKKEENTPPGGTPPADSTSNENK